MDRPIDRRRFVETTAGALLGGGLLCGLEGCATLATVSAEPRDGRIRLRVRDHPRLGSPGGYVRVRAVGHPDPLLVFSEGPRTFRVLSPICTHQRCVVNVEGGRLVCPCHGSQYDRAGAVLAGPAERPLARHDAVLTAGGELVIELEPRGAS